MRKFTERNDVSGVRPLVWAPLAESEAEEGWDAENDGQQQAAGQRQGQRRVRVGGAASRTSAGRQLRQRQTPPRGQQQRQQDGGRVQHLAGHIKCKLREGDNRWQ